MTGGRIKRIQKYTNNKPFMFTYGDGLSNININDLIKNHKSSNKLLTVSCVKMKGRFGELEISEGSVKSFIEKPPGTGPWINGGYFVCQPEVFDYINDDSTIFEREPMENLAKDSQMNSFRSICKLVLDYFLVDCCPSHHQKYLVGYLRDFLGV